MFLKYVRCSSAAVLLLLLSSCATSISVPELYFVGNISCPQTESSGKFRARIGQGGGLEGEKGVMLTIFDEQQHIIGVDYLVDADKFDSLTAKSSSKAFGVYATMFCDVAPQEIKAIFAPGYDYGEQLQRNLRNRIRLFGNSTFDKKAQTLRLSLSDAQGKIQILGEVIAEWHRVRDRSRKWAKTP